MSHLTPSFDRFPIPSAVPAVQWRRQWDLEDAARYRLAAEAARAGKQSAPGSLRTTCGAWLIRVGEWLRGAAVPTRTTRQAAS